VALAWASSIKVINNGGARIATRQTALAALPLHAHRAAARSRHRCSFQLLPSMPAIDNQRSGVWQAAPKIIGGGDISQAKIARCSKMA